ncbi:SDR family NAD(P)-dependent oxidoreductase [Stackebrandtia nassauensis]|uniref:Short-chain dehydrogenase/reductase SDR n=1 Tax=Stackebrandtia nassauensis (strain DSM 44728 / CIP 108903 / NRRL B-16338 / NBRC 102104 / LLR-40K-21) TaxID=446470 RepID=D3PWW2_STANL|nr:SDR family oxidoreductase [Stackebrandtia nassauensis]ADD45186.1 short-chain dehydrogenase/reductase SDR [Stackebrandtia nassauensis DSM 44728]
MDLRLQGKTALVTGASRGIGLATAIALAAEGVTVVGASRTVSDELRDADVTVITTDLSEADAPARLVSQAIEALGGRLDIVVNNAGGGDDVTVGGLLSYDEDFWQRIFDLNFYSAVRICRAAIPALLETGGSVVNVSSMGAKIPGTPGTPVPYATAKAALNAFGKSLSEEYGPQGISVRTVSPGPTLTSIWDADKYGGGVAASAGVEHSDLMKNLPALSGMTTGRFVTAEEVGAFITYLVSPLGESIVGSDHLIEGGAIKTV